MMWDHGYGGWGPWFGFVLMVVFVAAVVVAIVFLVRALQGNTTTSQPGAGPPIGPAAGPPRDSAEEILKRRYASGEIDRDEYQLKLADLSEGRGGEPPS